MWKINCDSVDISFQDILSKYQPVCHPSTGQNRKSTDLSEYKSVDFSVERYRQVSKLSGEAVCFVDTVEKYNSSQQGSGNYCGLSAEILNNDDSDL